MPWFYTEKGFWKAVSEGNFDNVEKYLAHAKKAKWINLRDQNGNTPLHVAARKEYRNTLRVLAQGGVPVDVQDSEVRTALNIALEASDAEKRDLMVIALLKAGANPNLANMTSRLPLPYALERGYLQIAERLLNAMADPNAGSPLAAALRWDKAHDLALKLLKAGATLESAGLLPGHAAAGNGRTDILLLLKEKGLAFTEINSTGQTMLHLAARGGHAKTARMLMDENMDFALQDGTGRSALHYAAMGGHVDIVKMLLDKSLDINLPDKEGQTPLHKAAQTGHAGMVNLLLAAGARTDILDNQKMSPLAFAQQKDSTPIIHMLSAAEKETRAKSATPLTAGVGAIPDAEAEIWVRLGNHQIARVGVYPSLGRKLTEIFNFESRGLMVISENLKTGAESMTPLASFDTVSEAALKKAVAAFREQGGKVDEAAVFARQLDKKTLPGPGS